jgi:hypothetical protein
LTRLAARATSDAGLSDWTTADFEAFLADLRARLRSAADGDGVYLLQV